MNGMDLLILKLKKFLNEKLEFANKTQKKSKDISDAFDKGITCGYILALTEIMDYLNEF